MKKAFCPSCGKEMEVDFDGGCMECGTGIAWPMIHDKENPAPEVAKKKR